MQMVDLLPDKFGRLPLHIACENEENTKNLLDLINIYSNTVSLPNQWTGKLALHYATLNPHIKFECIDALLKLDHSASTILDKNGNLPIHYLCQNPGLADQSLRALLQANPTSISNIDALGKLPLHLACSNVECHPTLIEHLVNQYPAACVTPDPEGNLPIHYIVIRGVKFAVDKVRILMKVDKLLPTKENKQGLTATMIAERNGMIDCLSYLYGIVDPSRPLDKQDDEEYFWIAMKKANSVLVQASLSKDPSLITKLNKKGQRPLQVCIKDGHKNIFDLLLSHIQKFDQFNALLSSPNENKGKKKPIEMAIDKARAEMLRALLQQASCHSNEIANKWNLIARAVKTQDKATIAVLVNAFTWEIETIPVNASYDKLNSKGESQDIELSVVPNNDTTTLNTNENKFNGVWDLSNKGLVGLSLPPEISKLPVKTIKLSNNRFTSLPTDALLIPSLERLLVDYNLIASIEPQAIRSLREHEAIRFVDLSHNKLQAIPPELYSLPNCDFDTSGNPLPSSLVFPAWFFGITFGEHNRAVLIALDLFWIALTLFIVLFGGLLYDTSQVRYVEFVLLAIFFGFSLLGTFYYGLFGIVWTDNIVNIQSTGMDDDVDDEDDDSLDQPEEDEEKPETKFLKEKAQEAKEILAIDDKKLMEAKGTISSLIKWLESQANTFAIIAMAWEFPLLLAFSFEADLQWPTTLKDIFQFLHFNFPSFNSGYEVGFWIAVVIVIAQRLLLELSRNPKVSRYSAAILQQTITLSALPLFVQVTKVLQCTYGDDGGILDDQPDVRCWTGKHLAYSTIGLLSFLLFYPMAVLSIPVWQQRSKKLQIKFPAYFLILSGQLKFILSLFTNFFTSYKELYLSINLIVSILLLVLVITLKTSAPQTLLKSKVKIGRIAAGIGIILGAIAAIIVFVLDSETAGLIVFFVMIAIQIIIGITALLLAKATTNRYNKEKSCPGFF